MLARSRPSSSIQAASQSAVSSSRDQRTARLSPNPGKSTVYVRKCAAKASMLRLHQRPDPESPCSRISGGPEPSTAWASDFRAFASDTLILGGRIDIADDAVRHLTIRATILPADSRRQCRANASGWLKLMACAASKWHIRCISAGECRAGHLLLRHQRVAGADDRQERNGYVRQPLHGRIADHAAKCAQRIEQTEPDIIRHARSSPATAAPAAHPAPIEASRAPRGGCGGRRRGRREWRAPSAPDSGARIRPRPGTRSNCPAPRRAERRRCRDSRPAPPPTPEYRGDGAVSRCIRARADRGCRSGSDPRAGSPSAPDSARRWRSRGRGRSAWPAPAAARRRAKRPAARRPSSSARVSGGRTRSGRSLARRLRMARGSAPASTRAGAAAAETGSPPPHPPVPRYFVSPDRRPSPLVSLPRSARRTA